MFNRPLFLFLRVLRVLRGQVFFHHEEHEGHEGVGSPGSKTPDPFIKNRNPKRDYLEYYVTDPKAFVIPSL